MAISDNHVVVLHHKVLLHLVVGPGPPHPHGDWRLLHDGWWLVHHLTRRDGDGAAAQVGDKKRRSGQSTGCVSPGSPLLGSTKVTDGRGRTNRSAPSQPPPSPYWALVAVCLSVPPVPVPMPPATVVMAPHYDRAPVVPRRPVAHHGRVGVRVSTLGAERRQVPGPQRLAPGPPPRRRREARSRRRSEPQRWPSVASRAAPRPVSRWQAFASSCFLRGRSKHHPDADVAADGRSILPSCSRGYDPDRSRWGRVSPHPLA